MNAGSKGSVGSAVEVVRRAAGFHGDIKIHVVGSQGNRIWGRIAGY